MSVNMQRREQHAQPEPLDESYWAALLQESELFDPPSTPYSQVDTNSDFVYQQAPSALFADDTADDDWREMQTIMNADLVLELIVAGVNRGGLLVEWRSLRGFVPASQLIDSVDSHNTSSQRPTLHERIGEKLHLRVIELNAEHNRLILSERAAQTQPGERAGLLATLHQGALVKGIVTNLCDFGAFIDLGGVEGLIHISELSWGRVGHPADLLRRGEEVRVHVLDVNAEAGRVALSLKRLNDDPWATVHLRYRVDEIIEGLITNVVDFGAFARIEDGLEGLIHVSELAEGHFLHPRNVVSEGQVVRARILTIDGRSRRLGLTLRAMNISSNG